MRVFLVSPEYMWALGVIVLLVALAYGGISYLARPKSRDAQSEAVTREVMDDPGPEPMESDGRQPKRGPTYPPTP